MWTCVFNINETLADADVGSGPLMAQRDQPCACICTSTATRQRPRADQTARSGGGRAETPPSSKPWRTSESARHPHLPLVVQHWELLPLRTRTTGRHQPCVRPPFTRLDSNTLATTYQDRYARERNMPDLNSVPPSPRNPATTAAGPPQPGHDAGRTSAQASRQSSTPASRRASQICTCVSFRCSFRYDAGSTPKL